MTRPTFEEIVARERAPYQHAPAPRRIRVWSILLGVALGLLLCVGPAVMIYGGAS